MKRDERVIVVNYNVATKSRIVVSRHRKRRSKKDFDKVRNGRVKGTEQRDRERKEKSRK